MRDNNDFADLAGKEIREQLTRLKKELDEFKNAKVKCGIIGRSGSGKSSLINAIAGEKIAEVGEVETTMDISKPYEHNGLQFFDLPGSSTQKFPVDTYIETMGIKNFDCVILVTSDRFYEDDLYLVDEIVKKNIPVYVTRSKIDEAVLRGEKRGVLEKTTLVNIYNDLLENLENTTTKGLYLTSSDFPTKYDLGNLISDIARSLNSIKRERFIADVSNASREIIEEKRSIAAKLVMRYSAVSAVNGLNPIPGLDVSVDIGILVKMNNDISKIYGLDKQGIKYMEELSNSVKLKNSILKAAQFTVKYLSKEAILILLKKYASVVVTKSISKWIPFVGQAIAAMIGFQMTSMMGDEMIDDAEKISIEFFDNLTTPE